MDSTVRAKDCARVYASGNFCDARLFLFGPAHFILRGPNMRLFLLLTIVTVLLSDPGHLRSQDLQWNFDNDLGMVHPGDTACKQIFLVNIGNSSIDVTGIVISQGSHLFHLPEVPQLPSRLAPGDSVFFSACFIAPLVADTMHAGRVQINFAYLSGMQDSGLVNLSGSTLRCLSTSEQDVSFGIVTGGTVASRTIRIQNSWREAVTIDSAFYLSENVGVFSIPATPLVIPATGTLDVDVTFTPGELTEEANTLIFETAQQCGNLGVSVFAWTEGYDSVSVPLFSNTTRSLNFTGTDGQTEHAFRFYNDQADSIKIVSVALRVGARFSISDILPSFPVFKLGPSETMDVLISLTDTAGVYDDTLVVTTETGITSLEFPFRGYILGSSSVSIDPLSRADLVVNRTDQNRFEVRIINGQAISFELIDILGRIVASSHGISEWAVPVLSKGSYIFRATGYDTTRSAFTLSKKISVP
jgi:hypothetical protein